MVISPASPSTSSSSPAESMQATSCRETVSKESGQNPRISFIPISAACSKQPLHKSKLPFQKATVVPKRKKKTDLDSVEEFLIKSIDKKEKESKAKKPEDADDYFCHSIAPTLQRLGEHSIKKNHLAKLKIQKWLYEIEYDDNLS